jgi:hypothetical protein
MENTGQTAEIERWLPHAMPAVEMPRPQGGINELRRYFYDLCSTRADWHRQALRFARTLTPEQIRYHSIRMEMEERAASAWYMAIGQ